MTYLFGDATPFPLEENFIDTITDAVTTCVGLFQLDVEQAELRQQAREVTEQADRDTAELAQLARAMEAALAPMMPEGPAASTTERVVTRLAELTASQIKQARLSVVQHRDSGLRAAKVTDLGPRILAAMETFFLRQQMPKTIWLHNWASGRGPAEAELEFTAASPGTLQTEYRADIPSDSIWSGPIRLEDMDDAFHLEFTHKGGWLKRGTHSGKIALERLFLTEVVRATDSSWFMLRQNAAKPSIGYKVIVRSRDYSSPVVLPIDARDEMAEPMGLENTDEAALLVLWKLMKRQLRVLSRHRTKLLGARFREQSVMDLSEPAELAECVLLSLAPLIRQIRLRSRVPGELVLKRDLGDGRREELFVPRKELENKFASLPYEQRACFSAVGLDAEATSEFLQRSNLRLEDAERSGDTRAAQELRRARRIATSSDAG